MKKFIQMIKGFFAKPNVNKSLPLSEVFNFIEWIDNKKLFVYTERYKHGEKLTASEKECNYKLYEMFLNERGNVC